MNLSWLADFISCVCLAAVFLACALHLNTMDRKSAECERWGFILTGIGAFASALSIYVPTVDEFDPGLVMHVGMGLIAVAMARGDLRDWLARAGRWDGRDRRDGKQRISKEAA